MSLHRRFDERLGSAPSIRLRATAGYWMAVVVVVAATGCIDGPRTVLERLSEANRLTASLLVQFTKATDAGNRAVMADTDEASVAFAREAEVATQAVQTDVDALGPILRGLDFSSESHLLEEFGGRFAKYRALDRNILKLAVENTNLKAQRLSFGAAQKAVDALRDSLQAVTAVASENDTWHVKALVGMAVAAVREIQVLQAPHIAEGDEAAMTPMEERMVVEEATARSALKMLASLGPPASRRQLAAATGAFDQFMSLNSQIIHLSRRNSNVRSLALSLGEKRTLTAACEDSLRALQDVLAKRGFSATR